MRNLSESTDLRDVLVKKIPIEQERVKNFRKQYGSTKVGEVNVDMVSFNLIKSQNQGELFGIRRQGYKVADSRS